MNREQRANKILVDAIDTFGAKCQIAKSIEELSELIKELAKYTNYGGYYVGGIREEMADVKIMLSQLVLLFGPVDDIIEAKMNRLQELIINQKEGSKL